MLYLVSSLCKIILEKLLRLEEDRHLRVVGACS